MSSEKAKILARIYIKTGFLAVVCIIFSVGSTILLKEMVNLVLGLAILATLGYSSISLKMDEQKGMLETVWATCKDVQTSVLSKNALFQFETDEPVKGQVIYIKAKKMDYFKGVQYCLVFRNSRGHYNENTLLGKEERMTDTIIFGHSDNESV